PLHGNDRSMNSFSTICYLVLTRRRDCSFWIYVEDVYKNGFLRRISWLMGTFVTGGEVKEKAWIS
ncbi:MAG: hypothetical protein ABI413_06150, partial [Ktedonobacteraceae bacterium]